MAGCFFLRGPQPRRRRHVASRTIHRVGVVRVFLGPDRVRDRNAFVADVDDRALQDAVAQDRHPAIFKSVDVQNLFDDQRLDGGCEPDSEVVDVFVTFALDAQGALKKPHRVGLGVAEADTSKPGHRQGPHCATRAPMSDPPTSPSPSRS
jgi:hypothetical protein